MRVAQSRYCTDLWKAPVEDHAVIVRFVGSSGVVWVYVLSISQHSISNLKNVEQTQEFYRSKTF